MKKLFLIITVISIALSTYASDYSWLVIHQTNGPNTYIKANGARFSVSDGKLIVNHTDGTFSFNFSDLSYMAFTSEDAGVESVLSDRGGETEVYSDKGMYIGQYASAEAAQKAISNPGVYVLKNRKGTAKIMITK